MNIANRYRSNTQYNGPILHITNKTGCALRLQYTRIVKQHSRSPQALDVVRYDPSHDPFHGPFHTGFLRCFHPEGLWALNYCLVNQLFCGRTIHKSCSVSLDLLPRIHPYHCVYALSKDAPLCHESDVATPLVGGILVSLYCTQRSLHEP